MTTQNATLTTANQMASSTQYNFSENALPLQTITTEITHPSVYESASSRPPATGPDERTPLSGFEKALQQCTTIAIGNDISSMFYIQPLDSNNNVLEASCTANDRYGIDMPCPIAWKVPHLIANKHLILVFPEAAYLCGLPQSYHPLSQASRISVVFRDNYYIGWLPSCDDETNSTEAQDVMYDRRLVQLLNSHNSSHLSSFARSRKRAIDGVIDPFPVKTESTASDETFTNEQFIPRTRLIHFVDNFNTSSPLLSVISHFSAVGPHSRGTPHTNKANTITCTLNELSLTAWLVSGHQCYNEKYPSHLPWTDPEWLKESYSISQRHP